MSLAMCFTLVSCQRLDNLQADCKHWAWARYQFHEQGGSDSEQRDIFNGMSS